MFSPEYLPVAQGNFSADIASIFISVNFMSQLPLDPKRRAFIGDALKLGAGSLVLGSALGATARAAGKSDAGTAVESARSMPAELPGLPVRVFVDHDGTGLVAAERQGARFTSPQAEINLSGPSDALSVKVSCPTGSLSRVVLRWEMSFPGDAIFLGDHWERGYGDLQWRTLQPERVMPWYFAAHDRASGQTFMAGVKTQPSALCFWTADAAGVSLWLDFRNGGSPCRPGDRVIAAATVVSLAGRKDETPFSALSRFCVALCPKPRLASAPICGNNNWYYAYGHDFDANAMRRDAAFLASLAGIHPNRPYCVIDAGWTPGTSCPGGPWTAGKPDSFPDMPGLAADMKKLGVRPGIWMRPTALMTVDDPHRLRAGPCTAQEKPLDLTLPENLKLIHDDVARIRSWGYELVKHDFSTYDIFGRWGFEMGAEITDAGWHFADQSLTNAEIILQLYRTLRAGAGDAVLLGCNTVGHLGAGIFEIQRTGDDTSGHVWERTRRMGINTLAFRLPQNGAFFASDPDCAAHTDRTPWEFDRQFLDLVARSGTALFVSVDPRTVTPEQKAAFRAAMQTALSGGAPGGCEPLDWLGTTTPREWRLGSEKVTYHWEEPAGANPLRV
jgi:alpha-galactosidase